MRLVFVMKSLYLLPDGGCYNRTPLKSPCLFQYILPKWLPSPPNPPKKLASWCYHVLHFVKSVVDCWPNHITTNTAMWQSKNLVSCTLHSISACSLFKVFVGCIFCCTVDDFSMGKVFILVPNAFSCSTLWTSLKSHVC